MRAGVWLPGGSGDVGGEDVRGVPVQRCPGAVVAHGGARVGVRGGFLHISERDGGAECGCDKRVSRGVRADWFVQSGASGDAVDDPPGAVPIQPRTGRGQEDRSFAAFADGEVDHPGGARREQDDSFLAALADDGQGAVGRAAS